MGVFFDLQKSLTTDRTFALKTQRLLNKLIAAEKSGNEDDTREAMIAVLRHCHWNPSLFVPYYFPKYPEDEPMTLWTRPHAFSMMALMSLGETVIAASRQIGKCLSSNELCKIRTQDGEEKEETMGDLFNQAKQAVTVS